MSDINGHPGVEGRGNIANTTINMPRLALLANKNIDEFFKLLFERIDDAKDSLIHRKAVLSKLKGNDRPFTVGQNLMVGSENIGVNDSIAPILEHGTWGIGYIGLAETLMILTGKHHGESQESLELGYKIMREFRERVDKLKEEYKMNFSVYSSPAEGLSGKFIKQDRKKFGIIPGVTDKGFYTNSFHIPVNYPISIMDKLKKEAPFHKMCNGGFISYIELDDYPTPELVEQILVKAFTETNIGYVGINFHIRYCKECGRYLHGETVCECGSTHIQGISRVTGYLSLDERFGEGKVYERAERIDHNAEHHKVYDMIITK